MLGTRKRQKRVAQASMEFLSLTVTALAVFIVFYSQVSHINKITYENRINLLAREISEKAAYEINIAAAQGDGYYKEFVLQNKIGSYNYNITIAKNKIFVEWELGPSIRTSQSSNIVLGNISGTLSPGWNFVENKKGIITVGAV